MFTRLLAAIKMTWLAAYLTRSLQSDSGAQGAWMGFLHSLVSATGFPRKALVPRRRAIAGSVVLKDVTTVRSKLEQNQLLRSGGLRSFVAIGLQGA